jgi:hypothetical protein
VSFWVGLAIGLLVEELYDIFRWLVPVATRIAARIRARQRCLTEVYDIEYGYRLAKIPSRSVRFLVVVILLVVVVLLRFVDEFRVCVKLSHHAFRRRPVVGKSVRQRRASTVVTVMIGVAAALTLGSPPVALASIEGSVRCTDGVLVEGIWVNAGGHASGFADWHRLGNRTTTFQYDRFKEEQSYMLTVGCGGSPERWRTNPSTPLVSGSHHNFVCDESECREA